MKKTMCFLVMTTILLMFLTSCSLDEKEKLPDKVKSEISYFENRIIKIINGLNNITFENYKVTAEDIKLSNESKENSSEVKSGGNAEVEGENDNNITTYAMSPNTILNPVTRQINWTEIKNEIENMYDTWNTILLDIYELDVPNDDILGFSKDLDIATTYIKKEDKSNSVLAMANLFKYLPKYAEKIYADKMKIDILKTKSYVINAYALADIEDWIGINEEMDKAIDSFKLAASYLTFIPEKNFKSNKIYVLLNELKNSLELEDKDIFYIKYKNLMEELVEV